MRGTSALTPRARALGAALRRARVDARFGLRELARRAGVGAALLSNWELALRVPSVEDVAGLLGALGITGQRKEELLGLARGGLGPNWVAESGQTVADIISSLERTATGVIAWHPFLIPGVLQTAEYGRVASAAVSSGCSVPTEAYVGENALSTVVGDADTMGRQLCFLADTAAAAKGPVVRVVPACVGWHPALLGPFTLYRTANAAVVHCQHHGAATFLFENKANGKHQPVVASLRRLALSEQETAELLLRKAQSRSKAAA
ncbi:Scr1 family TA system antitoxin-like transcriptional regulator [Amycolatopsis echigonensis]|uniref:Helix-turn-helix transcriptional regulator n=1 Tax=Amycolatopsis echigonensis TaxID=2576905 RepID=A0A8E1W115_9PSEU|nr:Scr1 family TA system antitoxin-like transcriptional regulator [Amycolatopsis echigonensis]MBB2502119.1 helix-turn-helix transcriptional regulator [Amycolatopsis echigonensis]